MSRIDRMVFGVLAVAFLILVGSAVVLAQPAQPGPVAPPIDLPLSANEQESIKAICSIAMKSPALNVNDTLDVGGFCAMLRARMVEQQQKKPAAPPAAPANE